MHSGITHSVWEKVLLMQGLTCRRRLVNPESFLAGQIRCGAIRFQLFPSPLPTDVLKGF